MFSLLKKSKLFLLLASFSYVGWLFITGAEIQFFSFPGKLFRSCILAPPLADSGGLEFRVEFVTLTSHSLFFQL